MDTLKCNHGIFNQFLIIDHSEFVEIKKISLESTQGVEFLLSKNNSKLIMDTLEYSNTKFDYFLKIENSTYAEVKSIDLYKTKNMK